MPDFSVRSPYKEVGINAFIPQTLRKKKGKKLLMPTQKEINRTRKHEKVCLECGGSGEVRIWHNNYLARCEVCKLCDGKGIRK